MSLVPVRTGPGGGGGLSGRSRFSVYGKVIVIWDYAELDYVLKQRGGPVGRDLERRATKVMWAAKAQAGIRTGALKLSIHMNHERTPIGQKMLVGSPLSYALMHHEGTKPHVIVAKPPKMLRFVSKGKVVFTDIVLHPGTRPNKYLTDNLPLALA